MSYTKLMVGGEGDETKVFNVGSKGFILRSPTTGTIGDTCLFGYGGYPNAFYPIQDQCILWHTSFDSHNS